METVYMFLTDAQKDKFNKLKKAYEACITSGIYFVNNYGTLEAYDSALVENYADDSEYKKSDARVYSSNDVKPIHTMNIVQEWTDDEHLIKLTEKGEKGLQDHKKEFGEE